MENDRVCYAHSDKPRALLALSFPFLAIGTLIWVMWEKGYYPWEYPLAVIAGQVSLASQILMWVALVYWVVRYWGTARETLASGLCLVWQEGDELRFSNGHSMKISDLRSIRGRTDLRGKYVVFLKKSGEVFQQSVMFARERQSLARDLSPLLDEVDEQT